MNKRGSLNSLPKEERAARRRHNLRTLFIGPHAKLMGWKLATRDVARYRAYFPAVELIEPVTLTGVTVESSKTEDSLSQCH